MKILKMKSLYKPSLIWKAFTLHTFNQFYAAIEEYYAFLRDLQNTDVWKDVAQATVRSIGEDYMQDKSLNLLVDSENITAELVRRNRVYRMFSGAHDSLRAAPTLVHDDRWWDYGIRGSSHPDYCICDLCEYACWVGFRYTAARLTKLTRSSGFVFDALSLSRPDWLQEALV